MGSLGEELERLARLKLSGDITEAEYEALMARSLSGLTEQESSESESPPDEPFGETAAAPGRRRIRKAEPPVVVEPVVAGASPPSEEGETQTKEPGAAHGSQPPDPPEAPSDDSTDGSSGPPRRILVGALVDRKSVV